MNKAAHLLFMALLALLMVTPVFGVVKVWPINSAIVDVLVFLFSGLIVSVALINARIADFKVSVPLYFFVALIGVLVISVAFNTYSYEASWRWYLVCFIFSIFIVIAANEIKARSSVEFNLVLAHCLWYATLIYCLVSLLKYYGFLSLLLPWVEASSGRLSGVWNQPNLTTTTAWLGVMAGATLHSQKINQPLFYAGLLSFGWVIACAASRMSWLILISLGGLIIVSQLPKYINTEVVPARKFLLRSLITISIMLVVIPQINEPLRQFLAANKLIENGASVALVDRAITEDVARLSEYSKLHSSIEAFNIKQLLFGMGPGNYSTFSFEADMAQPPENLVPSIWLHSHNLFSMIFVEFGILGLLIVTAFVISIGWVALTRPFDLKSFFSVGVLGVIFIHSNLEFPLWYPWFLVITCLFLANLFDVNSLRAETKALKPILGVVVAIMTVALVVNVSYQYVRIIKVAVDPDPKEAEFRSLALLANDSLMGPYAVLRKYRDFAPESTNLEWQLNEARRMKTWQPRDLVLLREYSILILKGDVESACEAAQSTAYRYPKSAPIMLEHSVKSKVLSPFEIVQVANCIELGLAPRGETIPTMQEKNQRVMLRM